MDWNKALYGAANVMTGGALSAGEVVSDLGERLKEFIRSKSGVNQSASDLEAQLKGLSDQYINNRDFEVEQAQKQMDFQTSANKLAMDFSAEQAELAYQRQRELRQTAYQDTVQDLKAAGLNPILAYSQGASSTPSVSSASGVSSSGSKADLSDTGYDLADLYYRIWESELSSSTAIKTALIGAVTSAVSSASSAGAKSGGKKK